MDRHPDHRSRCSPMRLRYKPARRIQSDSCRARLGVVRAGIGRRRIAQREAVSVCPVDHCHAELRAAAPNTIWASGCNSWYIGTDGVPHPWPWTPERHREMLARPHLDEWEFSRKAPAATTVVSTTPTQRPNFIVIQSHRVPRMLPPATASFRVEGPIGAQNPKRRRIALRR